MPFTLNFNITPKLASCLMRIEAAKQAALDLPCSREDNPAKKPTDPTLSRSYLKAQRTLALLGSFAQEGR